MNLTEKQTSVIKYALHMAELWAFSVIDCGNKESGRDDMKKAKKAKAIIYKKFNLK